MKAPQIKKIHFQSLVLFLSLCFCNINAFAQKIYYVSSEGSDSASGTSPSTSWKTLKGASGKSFAQGDKLLLKRGDVFYGNLNINVDGVTIDAYGDGEKPVISNSEKITGTWKNTNGNIWETTVIGKKPDEIRGVYKKGEELPISRYPNKSVNGGYLNFQSHDGLTTLIDNNLTGSPNWTGAEVVIRCERFRLFRTTVTNQNNNKLTIPASPSIAKLPDGYGYFFVNNIKAIDKEGEWAYEKATGKLYLCSKTNPGEGVTFIRPDTAILIKGANNVTIRNIQVNFSGKIGILISNSTNVLIDGLSIKNGGGDAVIITDTKNTTIQNSVIAEMKWSGIYSTKNSVGTLIKNNAIYNIGDGAYGKNKTFIGIDLNSSDSQVLNNKISKTGYSGILSAGANNLIKRNVVDSACLLLDDNGGIYTNFNINNTAGTIIEENIITNTQGELKGAPGAYSLANGIYLDNNSQGIIVRNNTIANTNGSGLFIHGTKDGISLYNNTAFHCGVSEMFINTPYGVPRYHIEGNILVSNSQDQEHRVFQTSRTDKYTLDEIGTFKNNTIINPYNSKSINFSYKAKDSKQANLYTIDNWKSAVENNSSVPTPGVTAAGIQSSRSAPRSLISKLSPQQVQGNSIIYYNTTNQTQTYQLPQGAYNDSKNNAFSKQVILQPYSSIVLFKQ